MSITASDFTKFFEDVHQHPPFEWQAELVEKIFEEGWPKVIDMPTSSGKTAVIDMAVFHLAAEAEKKDRKAPIRIVYVVDRRLVVDDAFDHAHKIMESLKNSSTTITRKISEALKAMSPTNTPLEIVKLRGGMPRENDWSKTPSQPLVIISTVDQTGSRLLFRGYGVSHTMKPIQAGLFGTDAIIILDEAHTSQQFMNTLKYICAIRRRNACQTFQTVFMSATPPPHKDDVFPSEDQKKRFLSDEKISQRVKAHKYAELVKINSKANTSVEFADWAFKMASREEVKTVGVVVNRVLMAREVFEEISNRIKNRPEYDAHLLIGRSRPLDRDMFVKREIKKIRIDSTIKDKMAIFFVATQCIEVGVDVSFDALITQIAPIDSLCQRFGRLNRTGKYERSNAAIVAPAADISPNTDDPVYGNASVNTWNYLKDVSKNGEIDFGLKYFVRPNNDVISKLIVKRELVDLFPAYIRLLEQTRPLPHPDPSPELFLHGLDSRPADVQIIWRADLMNDISYDLRTLCSIPSPLEAISIPIWTAKKWLIGKNDPDATDVEGATDHQHTQNRRLSGRGAATIINAKDVTGSSDVQSDNKYVLLWRGMKDEDTGIIDASNIRPGDTIIVPASYGGCDTYGWHSDSLKPVRDIGMEANLVHYGLISLRFVKSLVEGLANIHTWNTVEEATYNHVNDDNFIEFFEVLIGIDGLPAHWKKMLNVLKDEPNTNKKAYRVYIGTDGGRERITGITYKKRLEKSKIREILACWKDYDHTLENMHLDSDMKAETEEEYSGETTVNLTVHCEGVKNKVASFTKYSMLSQHILEDMKLAAWLHDSGKAERRTQAFLRGVDADELEEHILCNNLIAKSTYDVTSGAEFRKYMKKAQLPKGHRHECWSVSLAKNHSGAKMANDPELVLYLIGTHHGYGRPLFPPTDGLAGTVTLSFDGATAGSSDDISRLDSDWVDMYERLHQRYDPWTLAYMEAVIRLADHRQSEQERSR